MKAKHLYFPAWIALALVLPASADIIYSNFQNISIPATFDGLYLDVDGGNGWNTNMAAPVAGWDINPFYGGKVVANSPAFQPVRSGTGSSSPIIVLAAGASVGTGSVFSTFVQGAGGESPGAPGYGGSQMLTGSGGNFTAGTEGYLGFRLNGNNYGWMRTVLTDNTAGAVIKDWAYDNSTGTTIKAGLIQTDVTSGVLTTTTLSPGASDSFVLASALTNGVVSGGYTNSVLKQGDGTVTLSTTSSYTGATNVSAGTLLINGNISTSMLTTVENGGTLGGSGSVGALTVNNGGTLAPGSSPSTLTVAGALGLNNTSILAFAFNPLDATVGSNINDLVSVSGNLTLNGLLNVTATSGNFSSLTSGTWRMFDYTGSLTNNTLAFNTMPTLASGYSWLVDTSTANQVNLSIVPEPAAALFGGLGLLALLRRRRA